MEHSVEISGFSVVQNLREITFGESRNSKISVLPFVWGSEFCLFGKFQPLKCAKNQNNRNSEPSNVVKLQILHLYNPQN